MRKYRKIIKSKTYQYIAFADGERRTFYNRNGLKDYPGNIIRDPRSMSYINLFINGVLQPEKNYTVRRGELHLHTIDVPPAGAPIVLQFIQLYLAPVRRKIRTKKTPPAYESEEE